MVGEEDLFVTLDISIIYTDGYFTTATIYNNTVIDIL